MMWFKDKWKAKLKALLEGLEIQNVNKFLQESDVEDYKELGEALTKRVKEFRGMR